MQCRAVLCLTLVTLMVTLTLSKNSYVITVPDEIRASQLFRIGVHIIKAPSDVNLHGEMIENGKVVSSSKKTFHPGSSDYLEFQPPQQLSYPELRFSATGGLSFTESVYVKISQNTLAVMIQTDKAVYDAGQTVHFRTFALYPNATLYNGPLDVKITDPKGNIIKQWLSIQENCGVVEDLMIMDNHPLTGSWNISVSVLSIVEKKTFEVAHYKLPKFTIALDLPDYILPKDTVIHGSVTAKYTYGKPLDGKVLIEGKLLDYFNEWDYTGVDHVYKQEFLLNKNGTATFSISLSKILSATDGKQLKVLATVTDEITNNSLNDIKALTFAKTNLKIEFADSMPETFKPGIPYRIYVLAKNLDGTPVTAVGSTTQVQVKVTGTFEEAVPSPTPSFYTGPKHSVKKLTDTMMTFSKDGILNWNMTFTSSMTELNVEVSYKTLKVSKTISKYHSPSNSYLELLLQDKQFSVGDTISIPVLSTFSVENLVYQIWSKGQLLQSVSLKGIQNKITITITSEMVPSAKIMSYSIRNDGEMVFDSVEFGVKMHLQNQMTITSSSIKDEPGTDIEITVSADPNSQINILAVDQSVKLLKSDNDITENKIRSLLVGFTDIKKDLVFPFHHGGTDASSMIRNTNLNVLTDAELFRYVAPEYYRPDQMCHGPICKAVINPQHSFFENGIMIGGSFTHFTPKKSFLYPVTHVRSRFPETWLWMNKTAKNDGQVTLTARIPDTLTSWVVNAFAVHPKTGLGVLNTPLKIVGYRQFFVTLTIPDSVVRGEQIAIQANVFNYMDIGDYVLVILKGSSDFTALEKHGGGLRNETIPQPGSVLVMPREARPVLFQITPNKIGLITLEVTAQSRFAADGIRMQLYVEAEGQQITKNTPVPLLLSSGQKYTQNIGLKIPTSIVKNSESVRISVVGDFLGSTIDNLERLLHMPTGCGEQTMIYLAPDVFIAEYLKKTGELDKPLLKKVSDFIEKGLQNELKYQRNDGSFSVWGDKDAAGSMWLSSFVAKTLHRSRQFIQVDRNIIESALTWILNQQNADGSFPEPHKVYHTEMQGGSGKDLGLVAFVLISLEEILNSVGTDTLSQNVDAAIRSGALKARTFLEMHIKTESDGYILAITSYALCLSGSKMADEILHTLSQRAVDKDGMRFWEQTKDGKINPLDIEMTAYVLLSLTHKNDIHQGMNILKWLISQQNPRGGFQATQDTVVALQAMSEFITLMRSRAHHSNFNVSITAGSFSKDFSVTESNALVLQSVELPTIPSSIYVTATGSGLGLVQVTTYYNIKPESSRKRSSNIPFSTSVTMTTETINFIEMKICTSRKNNDKNGMVVQEIGIPSGFEADMQNIQTVNSLRRIEEIGKNVVFYFDEITPTPVCVNVKASRVSLVAKTKPSMIKVYDYYRPANQMTMSYSSTVLQHSNICDVCSMCRPCQKFPG